MLLGSLDPSWPLFLLWDCFILRRKVLWSKQLRVYSGHAASQVWMSGRWQAKYRRVVNFFQRLWLLIWIFICRLKVHESVHDSTAGSVWLQFWFHWERFQLNAVSSQILFFERIPTRIFSVRFLSQTSQCAYFPACKRREPCSVVFRCWWVHWEASTLWSWLHQQSWLIPVYLQFGFWAWCWQSNLCRSV